MPVGTQVFVVMFYDDKPAVSNQSTTAVHHLPGLGGEDLFALRSGDLDTAAQRFNSATNTFAAYVNRLVTQGIRVSVDVRQQSTGEVNA